MGRKISPDELLR